jgi:hypothetical protein
MRTILGLILLAGALFSQAPQPRTFTGQVTDSLCANADHRSMHMGDTDGDCTRNCVLSHGAQYVLFDGKDVYILADQKAAEQFAGMKIEATGVLDAKAGVLQARTIKARR